MPGDVIDRLALGTSFDGSGWAKGIDAASAKLDSFLADASKGLASIPVTFAPSSAPTMPSAMPAASGGSPADQMLPAVLAASGKIEAALNRAFAPMADFVPKFERQFDVVGRAIVNSIRKTDDQLRFPAFNAGIDRARKHLQSGFTEMEGTIGRFARFADTALDFGKWTFNLNHTLGQMRRSTKGTLDELAPPVMSKASAGIMGVNTATQTATRSFKALGTQIALSLGMFGVVFKGMEFLKDGIKGASSLNETIGKTEDVLGSAAPAVKDFADVVARDFGLVKKQTLDAASGFGGIGKGLGGLAGGELSDFSIKFTKMAADLQSFAEMDFSVAAQSLRTVLSGEQSDVLKQLGVVINETTIKQRALSEGMVRSGQELSEAQKVKVREILLTEGLRDASNNLAKTIGSPANQAKKLAGTLTNLGTSIGSALLPVVSKGLSAFNSLATSLSAGFESARPAFERFTSGLASGFDAFMSRGKELGDIAKGIGSAIVGAFSDGSGSIGSFLPSFDSLVNGIKTGLLSAKFFITDAIDLVKQIPANLEAVFGGTGFQAIAKFAGWLKAGLVTVFDNLAFAVRNAGTLMEIGFIKAYQYADGLGGEIEALVTNFGRLGSFVAGNWADIMLAVPKTLARAYAKLGQAAWEFFKNPSGGFHIDFSGVMADFKALSAKLPEMAKNSWVDVEADINERLDRINKREADFAKGMEAGKPGQSAPSSIVGPPDLRAKSDSMAPPAVKPPPFDAEAAKELAKFVEDLKDKLKSPLDKYYEEISKLNEAKRKGLISETEYGQGKKAIESKSFGGPVKLAGVAELGSREAYSSVVQAISGKTSGPGAVEKISRDQLVETKGLRKDFRTLARAVESNSVRVVEGLA